MRSVHDNTACEVCNAPATVDLLDTFAKSRHLYCQTHKPAITAGQRNPRWSIERYRLPPGNPCSMLMVGDPQSAEHQSFREEMCGSKLLGSVGAVKYFLSKLTGVDQFALWSDEFIANTRQYIVDETNGAANYFVFDSYTVGFMEPFLKHAYETSLARIDYQPKKDDLAVVILLNNPMLTDEQIAEKVPTTVKQLSRNTNFKTLRSPRFHRTSR